MSWLLPGITLVAQICFLVVLLIQLDSMKRLRENFEILYDEQGILSIRIKELEKEVYKKSPR